MKKSIKILLILVATITVIGILVGIIIENNNNETIVSELKITKTERKN